MGGWAGGLPTWAGSPRFISLNSIVPHFDSGQFCDVDYISNEEGDSTTQLTFAAITFAQLSRGVSFTLLADGAVRSFSEDMDLDLWRALGTRSGGEIISEFYVVRSRTLLYPVFPIEAYRSDVGRTGPNLATSRSFLAGAAR